MIEAGTVFGRWTVVGTPDPRRRSRVLARCSCGTERLINTTTLERGLSKGCVSCADFSTRERSRVVITPGDRFGAWTVLSEGDRTALGARTVTARCDCGVERQHIFANLRNGASTRCQSCAARDVAPRRTHGLSGTSLHSTWSGMLSRCHNPNSPSFHRYGGRGIRVCSEWHGFATFAAYVAEYLGERPTVDHSIDRIDNDRGYEPGNIRWATQREQMRNTRRSRRLVLDGAEHTLQDIADRTGITREGVRQRLARGWTVEECVQFGRGERKAARPVRVKVRGCSTCGQPGHYARTCGRPAKPVREPRPVHVKPVPVVRDDGRRGYRCGCCGEHGHQARTCTRRQSAAA